MSCDPQADYAQRLAQLSTLSEALTLGDLFRRELTGRVSLSLDQIGGRVVVLGSLNLSFNQVSTRAYSDCGFYVGRSWRTRPPVVFCRAPWRPPVSASGGNAEWHVNGDGSLCYELPDRWQRTLTDAEAEHGVSIVLRLAAAWCLSSVRWLLYHHLEAFRANLQLWPTEWPAWGHYERGRAEYAKLLAEEDRRSRRSKHLIQGTKP